MIPADINAVPFAELPDVAAEIERARVALVLRLASAPSNAPSLSPSPKLITADEAAAIAGTNRRWILTATSGLSCRRDLSRKQPRLEEASFRSFLISRRKR